jgi:hypothetical protein
VIVVVGSLFVLLYGFFVFFSENGVVVLKLTVFLVIAIVLGVIISTGYDMITKSPPESLDLLFEDSVREAGPGG